MASADPLALVPGPDADAAPRDALEALQSATWRVAAASDRMGLRLEGSSLGRGREIVSHPLVAGAVQVPPDGSPIVLLPDGPTIGGYPVLGVVPLADGPRLGQLRPGDEVRFGVLDAETARARGREQAARLGAAAAMLRADAVWHALPDHAGG
jgi:allophanate hydrolase subunit 2